MANDLPKTAANPDSWEHNYRVSYAVNYALKQVGALPERHYTNVERAALSEKALWAMTALRKSDAKTGTSESLILRDAQRYLYGSLGDAWLHARSDGADTRAPFILEVPRPARTPEDSAIRLAQPPGHVDLGHGESINLQTGRYTPGFGPKY
jgi:hypothetical protein